MKKFLSLVLAGLMLFTVSSAFGCQREGGVVYDDTRSLLNIGVFKAGYGTEWAEEAVEDFEKFYADTEFEPGKKGVQVVIDAKKEEFKASTLLTTAETYQNTLYFINENDFNGFYNKNLLADITDALSEKVYDSDGYLAAQTGKTATLSMNDIMYEEFKGKEVDGQYVDGYYEKNGKAYAAPWSFDCAGIIYDADLFDEYGYYFDEDGNMGKTQEDVDNGDCGPGPDGVMDTPDDGMPETWGQFMDLMDKMVNGGDNVIPFIWSGGTYYQQLRAYESIWANYEGYEDYMINFSLEGEDDRLGTITPETSAKLCEQDGIKAAIKAAFDIVKNGYYHEKSFGTTYTEAQDLYIKSIEENKRIAMFMEGGYWEVEAKATFDFMDMGAGTGYGERNFKRFPIPNFVDVEGIPDQEEDVMAEPETLIGHAAYKNIAFMVSKNACKNDYDVQLKLAKKFLQFVNSKEQLVKFTANTGCCIGSYYYNPTETEMETFTKFGKNVFEYINNGSKVAIDVPLHEWREKNQADYDQKGYFQVRESFNGTSVNFLTPFVAAAAEYDLTVDDCWKYMQTQYKSLTANMN